MSGNKDKFHEFFMREFGGTPWKSVEIPTIVNQLHAKIPHCDDIEQVRGDGNCLIRAILVHMYKFMPDLMSIALLDLGLDPFGDRDEICYSLRQLIKTKWKEFGFKGDWCYHMDDGAIDGLAIEALMKLLRISSLWIYQPFAAADRPPGWRNINTSIPVIDEREGVTVYVLTVNGCHYTGLV